MLFYEWILFFIGHLALACVLFNRVHAFAFPKPAGKKGRKITEKLILFFGITPFLLLAWQLLFSADQTLPPWLSIYLTFGQLVGVYYILRWVYRGITTKLPVNTKLISSENINLAAEIDKPIPIGLKANLFSFIPFNQVSQLKIENWELTFPALHDDLDGFKICQCSDLHFTGLIDREYFQKVVQRVNDASPDLVVITGDILDEDQCLDWIESVLGKLSAKFGVYFVRGNHDLMISDQVDALQRLQDTGMIWAASGNWHELRIGTAILQLAGNELPWYDAAAHLQNPPCLPTGGLRILLSHSPDQIGWAVKRDVDLMFAGHTHGGQIRLPIAGPVIAPSRYGIKFASGTFKIRETLMHVSRGISGDEPVRINCPPELGFFTLRKT